MSRSPSTSPTASFTSVRSSMKAYAIAKATVRAGRLDRVARATSALASQQQRAKDQHAHREGGRQRNGHEAARGDHGNASRYSRVAS